MVALHRSLRPFVLCAALLLAALALLLTASPASAHDELLGSDPANGAELDAVPAALTLTFSGAIAADEGASEVQVTDAAGTSLVAGAPVAQDNVLTQPLAGEASGAVTVLWKVVSSDGHPISGQFTFTVTPAPAPTETSTPAPTATETAEPTPSVEPTPTAEPLPEDPLMEAADMRPWLIGGILALLALAGGIIYLVVSRKRRDRALAENREKALGGAPGPDSTPPADR
ncbi:copper resistance CopC family protein [Microbacterium sp. CFBP9034]|uniref:copper resistance CopC family protein n=1 Tax=Microbacterium sp. CFBP9034 TaxID=3096540 RepID=UPI002A6A6A6D|nr:copper resistance protein CopC [Microbacterium sp. CFBP9034]MDY0910023.1 copper resistance protein CopC [Microbacterium sp. CFBP9034]